jgi:pimeloyl-ACP methyl ester carboxylesterase
VGAVWRPDGDPKAVLVMGHGVSTNRSVMASIAKAFAGQGYAVTAIDFWGHGRSRERFDWNTNAAQLHAWYAWARSEFPGVPMAYLGHSMGGFAGSVALQTDPSLDAFVSLGALPRDGYPPVKTLVAAGQFEELFTPEQARASAEGKADVLISPWSDHVLETWDPVLIAGIVAWVDGALGVPSVEGYSWGRWWLALVAGSLGLAASVLLATGATGLLRGPDGTPRPPAAKKRRFSLNLYAPAARIFGCAGEGQAPRTDTFWRAALLGLVYSAAFMLPLSFLLTEDIFVARLDHPARATAWAVVGLAFAGLSLLDKGQLERLAITSPWQRFAVSAATRAVPMVIIGFALRPLGPGAAFMGMLLCILGFVFVMLALVHATATRASGDYRTGAIANGILIAWVFCYWFPLSW